MNTKPKVYIHYNAFDFCAPRPDEVDVWRNYANPDSCKMFLLSAFSWTANDWQPLRLDSGLAPVGFEMCGALREHVGYYPLECWNVWFLLRRLAPCWYSSTDILNCNFTANIAAVATKPLKSGLAYSLAPDGTGHTWSTAVCYVTPAFCDGVIETIMNVDKGNLSLPVASIVTDENIINTHMQDDFLMHECRFAIPYHSPDWEKAKLLHFQRSILKRSLDAFPRESFDTQI